MLKMELFLYQDNASLFLELISNYLNAEKKNLIKILKIKETTKKLLNLPEQSFLVNLKNEIITDDVAISQILSNLSGRLEVLFGSDFNRIDSNINFMLNSKKKYTNPLEFLEFLDSHLLYNTFVNGFTITISDIFAYSQTIRTLATFKDAEKNKYCNVLRWVDHIQNLEGLKETIRNLELKLSIPFEPLVLVKPVEGKCPIKRDEEKKPRENKPEEKTENKNENNKKSDVEKVNLITVTPTENKEKVVTEPKKKENKPKPAAKKEEDDVHPISKLDIRVGKILNIFENKDSDKLFNEEVDLGNGEVRKIASGLKGKVPIEDLSDSMVVILCNLKERTLCGWPSHGMLLCASNAEGKIEPLRPPQGSKPGDAVTVNNFPRLPVAELHPKKNPWDLVKDDLTINEDKQATFAKVNLFETPNGVVTVKSLTCAKIS